MLLSCQLPRAKLRTQRKHNIQGSYSDTELHDIQGSDSDTELHDIQGSYNDTELIVCSLWMRFLLWSVT
jgi:hypothetical protein